MSFFSDWLDSIIIYDTFFEDEEEQDETIYLDTYNDH